MWWQRTLLIGLVVAGVLLVGATLKSYCKVSRKENVLYVERLLGMKSYDLGTLTSWKELENFYKVYYRKIILNFGRTRVELLSHSDPRNVEELSHHLRNNYSKLWDRS